MRCCTSQTGRRKETNVMYIHLEEYSEANEITRISIELSKWELKIKEMKYNARND